MTSAAHGWFQKRLINSQVDPTLADIALGYDQTSDGTYFGHFLVTPNARPDDEYLVSFHTDDPENPLWVALRTDWKVFEDSNMDDLPIFFSKPLGFWDANEEFLFFEPSDLQGSGTGAETWGLLSGVLADEKRTDSAGRYVNHGFERYQGVVSSLFRAAINKAKI